MKRNQKIVLFTTLGIAAIGIPFIYKKYWSNATPNTYLPGNNSLTPGGSGNYKQSTNPVVVPPKSVEPTPPGWKGGTVPKIPAKVVPAPVKTEQQIWAEQFVETLNADNNMRNIAIQLLQAIRNDNIINSSQFANLQYGYVYQFLDKNKVKQHLPVYFQMYEMAGLYNNDYAKIIVDVSAVQYNRDKPGAISEGVVNQIRTKLQTL